RIGAGDFAQASCAYLSSTLAPAFSSVALIFSASSLETLSLTGFGAPSTRSFASLRPRPVSARTSLMTSIFLSPAAASTTVNSVFSSAGAAPPAAPPGAAATATAAAADTPHFSSSSFASSAASSTVRLESSSPIFDRSAISHTSFSVRTLDICYAKYRYLGFALVGIGLDHAGDLGGRSVDELRDLGRRGLDQADQLGTQLIQRRQRGERLHAVRVQGGLAHRAAEDHELLVRLGEVADDLGRGYRIARVGDHGRPLHGGGDRSPVGAFKSDLGEPVLRHLHGCASRSRLLAQGLHLTDREACVVSHHHHVRGLEHPVEVGDSLFLGRSIHLVALSGRRPASREDDSRRLRHAVLGPIRHTGGRRTGTTLDALPRGRQSRPEFLEVRTVPGLPPVSIFTRLCRPCD